MWPGFKSRRLRHMWIEFVVGSLPCSERFFSEYSGFPLSSKTNIFKFQFDQESGRRRTTLWMCYLQIIIFIICCNFNSFTLGWVMETIVLNPWIKFCGVSIQIKPPKQYVWMVPFIFSGFHKAKFDFFFFKYDFHQWLPNVWECNSALLWHEKETGPC